MKKKLIVSFILVGLFVMYGCAHINFGNNSEYFPTTTAIPAADISVCVDGCSFTTIQEAINAASTESGMVISVEDAVHTEPGIIFSKNVIIQGKGQTETIIQAAENSESANDRIFLISEGIQVVIRHLTMRYGNPVGDIRSGGAIRNEGDLTLENVIIRENQASAGGGILNDGTLHIINSTIMNNIAKGGGDPYTECKTGGAIKIMSGVVTIENSTISNNQSKGKGGGIHVACLGELYITNSTVSGNYSFEDGGGIFINGMAAITHCTITENEAMNGGGIAFEGSGEEGAARGQLSYQNSIIVNNQSRLEKYGAVDCMAGQYTEIVLNSNNWVGDGNCAATYFGDLFLEPLADNGGFTQTHFLGKDSQAADLLSEDNCIVEYDQRGFLRSIPCDLGATENF
jgi:hypothetical protein